MPKTTAQNGLGLQPDALAQAVSHLRAGLRPDGTYEAAGEGEVAGYQWRILSQWAERCQLSVSDHYSPREGGREHDVFFDDATEHWIKFTKPWRAGFCVHLIGQNLVMMPATPLEYLQRWRIHNFIFDEKVQFLGIKHSDEGSRLVMAHRDIQGPNATWEQIEEAFVRRAGMLRLPVDDANLGGYEARAYVLRRLAVFDVRPLNCVYSSETESVGVIDAIPKILSRGESLFLHDLATGQRNFFDKLDL